MPSGNLPHRRADATVLRHVVEQLEVVDVHADFEKVQSTGAAQRHSPSLSPASSKAMAPMRLINSRLLPVSVILISAPGPTGRLRQGKTIRRMHLLPSRINVASGNTLQVMPFNLFDIPNRLAPGAVLARLPRRRREIHLRRRPTHRTKPTQPGTPPPGTTTERFTVTVMLGDHYLSSRDESETSYLDFARRRSYRISASSQTFSNTSLYAEIGFRSAELLNREKLSAAMAKFASSPHDSMDPVLAEHSLSVQSTKRTTLIAVNTAGDTSFTYREKLLTSYATEGFTLTQTESAPFRALPALSTAAPSEYRLRTAETRLVPQQISVVHYDVGVHSLRLHFRLLRSAPLAPILRTPC